MISIEAVLELLVVRREERDRVLREKGADYSRPGEALSNFYEVAKITGSTPQEVCLTLIAVKVARLSNLYRGGGLNGKPLNESIADTIKDLANYSELLTVIEEIEFNKAEDVRINGTSPYDSTDRKPFLS